jgi:methionyl aminopeptidase
MEVTRDSLWVGIRAIRRGGRLADISRAIEEYVNQHGMGIVRELSGHGIGKQLWEEPSIHNYYDPQFPNPILHEGMTLAIEPMVNSGGAEVAGLPDGWTVVTADGSLSAHYEHTVAITRYGYDILTLGPHDPGR